jgi:hypothetical protein
MRFKCGLKAILGSITIAGFGILLVWAFMHWNSGFPRNDPRKEEPARKATSASVQNGETIVTLDKAAQTKSDIIVASLKAIAHRQELRAYGRVLELQGLVNLRKNLIDARKNLVDLRNAYAEANAQVEKAKVNLDVSKNEYERLKALYEDNRNISEKALQAQEGKWRSDEDKARAAQEASDSAEKGVKAAEDLLEVLKDSVRQQWGNVLANWLFEAPPAFRRLIQQEDLLVQITLPSGERIEPIPETVAIEAAPGLSALAKLISPAPRTDPLLQGISYFYLAPAQPTGLLPGMNVIAYMPVGSEVKGVLVPASAVVWWQGKAWAYERKDGGQFARREVPTEDSIAGGYFVSKGFKPGDQIVVRGAQLLLSEEFLPKTPAGKEEDQD